MRSYFQYSFASFFCLSVAFSIPHLYADEEVDKADTHRSPYLAIGRFSTPPAIDGSPSDPVWQEAIPVMDFFSFGSQLPADEGKTEVRLGYDTDYLYVAATCTEPLLSVRSQRQSDIKALATGRDGKVIFDDSFLIILRPPGASEVYEYVINTKGIVSDSKAPLQKLWSGRDLNWNSQIVSAVKEGDGLWQLELKIPWKDMGGNPTTGDKWKVLLSRQTPSRGESVSWQPNTSIGAHDPLVWGELGLEEEVIPVRVERPESLQPGTNHLRVEFPKNVKDHEVLFSTHLRKETGTANEAARNRSRLKASGIVPFEIAEKGGVRFSWNAQDARTMRTYYRSPESVHRVRLMAVGFELTTKGPYKIFWNGQVISQGSDATATPVHLSLGSGLNVIAIEAQAGAFTLRATSPNLEGLPLNWKKAPQLHADAVNPDTDDSAWVTAAQEESDSKMLVGTSGAPAIYRHTFLIQHFNPWPMPDPALHIARESTQGILITVDGIAKRPLKDWSLHLQTPQEIDLKGVTGYFTGLAHADEQGWLGDETKPRFSISNSSTPQHHVVSADLPIIHRPEWIAKSRVIELFLTSDSEPTEAGGAVDVNYWISANDATVTQLPSSIPVRVIPPLQGKQPKQLAVEMWGASVSIMDNQGQALNDLLLTCQKAGVNYIIRPRAEANVIPKGAGIEESAMIRFSKESLDIRDLLKERPELRRIDTNRHPNSREACTSFLIQGDLREAIAKGLHNTLGQNPPKRVLYDYEFSPFNGPHSCYCEQCIEAFTSMYDIAEGRNISPGTIGKNYREQWKDFMAKQGAKLLRMLKDLVHQELPGAQFGIYSGYQIPNTQELYGINWRYVGELDAVDYGSGGYGRPVPGVMDTVNAISGRPFIAGELLSPYLDMRLDGNATVQPINKAALLRRFIDATGGILVYERTSMDGRSFQNLAETTRLVADYEPVFLHGKREAIAGFSEEEVQLLRHEGTTLLVLLNQRRTAHEYAISLPHEYKSGVEYYSKRKVRGGEEIKMTLEAGESAAIVLTTP